MCKLVLSYKVRCRLNKNEPPCLTHQKLWLPHIACQRFHANFYLFSESTPTILRQPRSVKASQYLLGCQATTGHAPAVFTLCTYSPVSVWAISSPGPSSLPPTIKLPSKLKLMLRTGPVISISVRWQIQSVVSHSAMIESEPPVARNRAVGCISIERQEEVWPLSVKGLPES